MTFLYQLTQFSLLTIFAVHISDFRHKKAMVPFGSRVLLVFLKLLYILPLVIFAWCLLNVHALGIYDGFAIVLTGLGTLVVAKAKSDLGTHHTWVGYRLERTRIVTRGIYSWVRHPLYTGIYLFIAGAICAGLPRVTFLLGLLAGISLLYIVTFLLLSARREAKHLQQQYADDYLDYSKRVHSFIPLRRYNKAA